MASVASNPIAPPDDITEAILNAMESRLGMRERGFSRASPLTLGGEHNLFCFWRKEINGKELRIGPQDKNGMYSIKYWWKPEIPVGANASKSFFTRVHVQKELDVIDGQNPNLVRFNEGDVSGRITDIEETLWPEGAIVTPKTDALQGENQEPKSKEEEGNKEYFHKQFPKLIKWISSRYPIWLYGAAGGGKSVVVEQIARTHLKLPFYPLAAGPTTSESRIMGFMNAGAGLYVQGILYRPYKEGGVLFIDEADVLDAQVLVSMNQPIANNYYMFPNGELVEKHKDFYIICGANTLGRGAVGGYKRNSLDVATRSRFLKVKFEYDEDLEVFLCKHKSWAKWVQKVRKVVESMAQTSALVTPRDSLAGDAAICQGLTPMEAAEATVFSELPADIKKSVITQCGNPPYIKENQFGI